MMGAKKPGLTGLARESADGNDSGASVTLAQGTIIRLLEGRVRPQRLPDLRTRSSPERVAEIRAALAPHLARDLLGRNDFEGTKTNRVYALLAKSPVFAELAIHPLAMAFVEAELGESCLLSAMLAINLHPGETVQPWHFDDSGARIPRPRPALGISTFWAIDDTTEQNGATEIIPGSHLWDGQYIEGAVQPAHFTNEAGTTRATGRTPSS